MWYDEIYYSKDSAKYGSSFKEGKRKRDSQSKRIATDCTICYHSCGMDVLVEDGRITKVSVIKVLVVTGRNPVVNRPDPNAFREALKKLDLSVVHDFFMKETAELAHDVLLGCSHLVKNGLAYSYNVCHGIPYLMLRKKTIEPLYES